MINQTVNQTAIEIAKSSGYTPNLVTLWASFVILLPIIFWAFSTNKTNWGRLWGIWFTVVVITGILFAFFLISPGAYPEFLTKLKSFFFS